VGSSPAEHGSPVPGHYPFDVPDMASVSGFTKVGVGSVPVSTGSGFTAALTI
jgi:hypothetical protein